MRILSCRPTGMRLPGTYCVPRTTSRKRQRSRKLGGPAGLLSRVGGPCGERAGQRVGDTVRRIAEASSLEKPELAA